MKQIVAVILIAVLALSVMKYIEGKHNDEVSDYEVGYVTYSIQYGDTMTTIVNRFVHEPYSFNEYMDSVIKINHIHPDYILAGDKLVLPMAHRKEQGVELYANDYQ